MIFISREVQEVSYIPETPRIVFPKNFKLLEREKKLNQGGNDEGKEIVKQIFVPCKWSSDKKWHLV